MMRICCSPSWEARQPGPSFEPNADSMGKLGSSDVTSTVAIRSRSSQPWSDSPVGNPWCSPEILFLILPFSPYSSALSPRLLPTDLWERETARRATWAEIGNESRHRNCKRAKLDPTRCPTGRRHLAVSAQRIRRANRSQPHYPAQQFPGSVAHSEKPPSTMWIAPVVKAL
jgi:hypothetical protein